MKNTPSIERYRGIVDDYSAFEAACNTHLPLSIWRNPLRATPEEFSLWLDAAPGGLHETAWKEGTFRVERSDSLSYAAAYLAGLFHIQEEISLLPVQLLDVRPGQKILDLCAAPGNKTAQIAAALGGTGTVIGNDINRKRLGVARTTMDRLGLTNAVLTVMDAASFPVENGRYDRVLADVPCTCEGTSRKHPSILDRFTVENSVRMSTVQYEILENAIRLCRPGGRIVYSTCTYAPEENEAVVARILTESALARDVRLIRPDIPGLKSAPGLTDWNGRRFPVELEKTLRFWPHLNDSGGFFVAVFEKHSGADPASIETSESHGVASLDTDELLLREKERFGLPDDVLESYRCLQFSTKYASLIGSGVELPSRPRALTAGVRALNTKGPTPRLSTGGAMLLGGRAEKSTADLNSDQLRRYLTRQDVTRSGAGSAEPGAMLVRSRNTTFGLGFLNDSNEMRSLFPRSWAGVEVSAWLTRE